MRRAELRQAITKKKAALRELDKRREAAKRELEALQHELNGPEGQQPRSPFRDDGQTIAEPATSREKVGLFRSLFRGREDVYPVLWTNAKTGRTGYAPACANEWVRGVCEKPRLRCGECPNQAFMPMIDPVILEHLQGRKAIGVYPMLPEETCWFLAADFDNRIADIQREIDEIDTRARSLEDKRESIAAHYKRLMDFSDAARAWLLRLSKVEDQIRTAKSSPAGTFDRRQSEDHRNTRIGEHPEMIRRH